jgi:hypothetical protein
MGLINREMASRRGGPFWGNLSDWKCFGEPFGTNSKITSVFNRLFGL